MKREVVELGQRIDTLEQARDAGEEELDCHRRELLVLQGKNRELQYQIEDLENRVRTVEEAQALEVMPPRLGDMVPLPNDQEQRSLTNGTRPEFQARRGKQHKPSNGGETKGESGVA
ncbi:hypothetical protein NDU88_008988 [Pleurodeles waltl]|uniref:Uncharacterized protein n=1 Tax=Pleurodeles waltl TaxID=8319 RepID=A0AAV7QU38_PLEWA|nr:hypothetical protein NDU88_008988 [Pleurodeles waltl]